MQHKVNDLPDALFDKQRLSWLSGEQRSAEQFLNDSGHEIHPESLLDLLYHEILLKEELGIDFTIEEYNHRYPELADELALHFEVHQAVRERMLFETALPQSDRSTPQWSAGDETVQLPEGEYEVQHLIGRGAMATVYQARHRQLHRPVALKVFQAGRTLTTLEAARIHLEAEAIARLAHPNIIQIFEIGDIHGSPFLALELAEGGTLAARLTATSLTANAAAELIETLARAIQHAHDREVIHRDLKPANILFAADGTPKITDFGLAKVLADRDSDAAAMTRTGEALGTPRYMSPEQAAGQHDRVCPATDVYALGTILYECLTGHAPFVSASVSETLYLIREQDPLSLRKQLPAIPRDLETICLHCLEKDPDRRYVTARELADDLHRFRMGEPIHVRPAGILEKCYKWCRKRPVHAAFTLMTTLLVTGGCLWAFTATQRERVRIHELRQDVARLMKAGRLALDRDDLEVAQSQFREAWQLVQAEPRLSDHETSVTGWLDHSRNALNRYHWKQRIPPRDYDHRRDEALLLSVLPLPEIEEPITTARQAIQEAMDLTIPREVTWNKEREQLYLIDAELVSRQRGPDAALALLEATDEFDSYSYHVARSRLLDLLRRPDEAHAAQVMAESHPPRSEQIRLFGSMTLMRDDQFSQALPGLDQILEKDPEHFAARLLQAVCFLKLGRAPEGSVGLTACIAQRPNFHWNHVLRGLARLAGSQTELAANDFRAALLGHPSAAVKSTVLKLAGLSEQTGSPEAPAGSPAGAQLTSPQSSPKANRFFQGHAP